MVRCAVQPYLYVCIYATIRNRFWNPFYSVFSLRVYDFEYGFLHVALCVLSECVLCICCTFVVVVFFSYILLILLDTVLLPSWFILCRMGYIDIWLTQFSGRNFLHLRNVEIGKNSRPSYGAFIFFLLVECCLVRTIISVCSFYMRARA